MRTLLSRRRAIFDITTHELVTIFRRLLRDSTEVISPLHPFLRSGVNGRHHPTQMALKGDEIQRIANRTNPRGNMHRAHLLIPGNLHRAYFALGVFPNHRQQEPLKTSDVAVMSETRHVTHCTQ